MQLVSVSRGGFRGIKDPLKNHIRETKQWCSGTYKNVLKMNYLMSFQYSMIRRPISYMGLHHRYIASVTGLETSVINVASMLRN